MLVFKVKRVSVAFNKMPFWRNFIFFIMYLVFPRFQEKLSYKKGLQYFIV